MFIFSIISLIQWAFLIYMLVTPLAVKATIYFQLAGMGL